MNREAAPGATDAKPSQGDQPGRARAHLAMFARTNRPIMGLDNVAMHYYYETHDLLAAVGERLSLFVSHEQQLVDKRVYTVGLDSCLVHHESVNLS